jgi:ankyrin repeat protein
MSAATHPKAPRLMFRRVLQRVNELADLAAEELHHVLTFRLDGSTLLHQAGHVDDIHTVSILLRMCADSNAAGDSNQTPLHEAVVHAGVAMMALLLRAGADPTRQRHHSRRHLICS